MFLYVLFQKGLSTTGSTNKYKKLIVNTLTFAVGTFGSKLLVYFMLPIYTSALTTAEYSVTDLIAQTANLLAPLVCLGITNSIIRFGLDKSYRKDTVFTTALLCVAFGFGVLLLFWPLMASIAVLDGYTILVYLYVLMSVLRSVCAGFVRALNKVRLFAYDGIQSTFLTILFTILYLLVFDMGITGYILAIVTADFLSTIFLFFAAGLRRYVRFSAVNKKVTRAMLRFSVPLIPTSLFWWVTNVSDRYMVSYMIGNHENGLYTVAYKIPTLINLLSSIFMEAWQMSAISEKDSPARNRFFSRVFNAYASLLFCAASFLTLVCQFVTSFLVADSYYDSWVYIPVLLLATVFSCFCSFLNSIYMVERKSHLSLFTIIAGAIVNIVLNFLLIPDHGAFGAAVATLLSYVVVCVLRIITAKQLIPMRINYMRLGTNILLVVVQCILTVSQVHLWWLWTLLLFLVLGVLNMHAIYTMLRDFLKNRRARSSKS